MRKQISFALSLFCILLPTLSACADAQKPSEQSGSSASSASDQPYIAVISKGFEAPFWQTVQKGAQDAAEDYQVQISYEGPPSESDIASQVDMVKAALAKQPDALCLAALDTESMTEQLIYARDAGIPVIGFDSGVPDAPENSIVATASTDNYAAGAYAAEQMFADETFQSLLQDASASAPVTIGVQPNDATSQAGLERSHGFIDKMKTLAESIHPDGVEVTGHDVFAQAASGPVSVSISVAVPPSTNASDSQATASTQLNNNPNMIGYFLTTGIQTTAFLSATNDGTDLNCENGKYKNLTVIGFDSSATQKNAVKNNYLLGSVSQNAYNIGYYAVELAAKARRGEEIDADIDTGYVFYTSENMDQPEIAELLYD